MSKRLQVILEDDEMRKIQDIARRRRTTVAEWVRQVLRAAQRQEPLLDASRKLSIVRESSANSFPTGDIDRMLAEIEQGYIGGSEK
ncbi:MAG: hypothetical protein MZW92_06785 [Comamonadaceae bacterium]|nr:hypothetical protein [Comamonadaceae bacterium]